MPSFNIVGLSTSLQALDSGVNIGFVGAGGALITGNLTAVTVTTAGSGALLLNDGVIASNTRAVAALQSMNLTNSGQITCKVNAILVDIMAATTTTTSIINTGEILSNTGSCIVSQEAGIKIANSGTMISGANTIEITATDLLWVSDISNSGLIQAEWDSNAILSNGTVRLTNTGTIVGDIVLGSGSDWVDTRSGTVIGSISLGTGNNFFRGSADDDVVGAQSGGDELRGGGGDDELSSSQGVDILGGGTGDDRLSAGDGNDFLYGGRGEDLLYGGKGVDNFTGGADGDRFAFSQAIESPAAGVADRILDMQGGLDVIDLSFMLPAIVTFVGENAFAGGGTASVRFVRSTGFLTLQADTDGNGTADFHVDVFGVSTLSLEDLILV